MTSKILFVDDDTNILEAFRRQFRNQYQISTASSCDEAFNLLNTEGPYAAVVSDLRMPGMNGIEFLARVQEYYPDTIRIMLTGYADLNTAIAAVNEGNVFRFLTKPVESETLTKVLDSAIEQYRLVTSEKELLEKTLKGSIKVLVDLLSLLKPVAFTHASQVMRSVRQIVSRLRIPNPWPYELAAMLSQIGLVTLPSELIEKFESGYDITPDERKRIESSPTIAHDLLINIPRLELVAKIIERQNLSSSRKDRELPPQHRDPVILGPQILKVALDYHLFMTRGMSPERAIERLRSQTSEYDPAIIDALDANIAQPASYGTSSLLISQLREGMVIAQPIRNKNGESLLSDGQEISSAVLDLLKNWKLQGDIEEPIQILMA